MGFPVYVWVMDSKSQLANVFFFFFKTYFNKKGLQKFSFKFTFYDILLFRMRILIKILHDT